MGSAFLLLLAPALAERADDYAWNTKWMAQTEGAIRADRDAATIVDELRALPLARTFAGVSDAWRSELRFVDFKSVDLVDVLNSARLPRVAKPYASLALNANLAFAFNDQDAAQYDVFNARYVVAGVSQQVPSFLQPLDTAGRYALYEAPTTGWAMFAASTVREAVSTDERLFFRMRDWLEGDGPRTRRFARYDYPAARDSIEATPTTWCASGRTTDVRIERDRLALLAACDSEATLVLKVTYHPNWQVSVDGNRVDSFMVSPGFIGIQLPAGAHAVSARYMSTPSKTPLLLFGLAMIAGLAISTRLGSRDAFAVSRSLVPSRGRAAVRSTLARFAAFPRFRRPAIALAFPQVRVRGELIAVASSLIVAMSARVPGLNLPLIEWHGWRQTWTAYTAVLYHEHGIDLLRPPLPVFGPPFIFPHEFPLFQAFAAIVMDIGVAPDLSLRLTALATFVLAALMLWALVRRMAGPLPALVALCAFVFLPLNFLFSRAALPEYLALAGALGWLYWGIAWRDRRQGMAVYAASMVAGTIGMLTKPTTPLFWVLPLILYRAAQETPGARNWVRARLDFRLVALILVPILIAYGWLLYADSVRIQQEVTSFLASTSDWARHFYYSNIAERLNPALWRGMWEWVSRYVIGVAFIPFAAVGLWAAGRSPQRLFWYGFVAAALLPILVFYGAFYRHDYYFIAITPEASALIALGVGWVAAHARTAVPRGAIGAAVGVAALLVAMNASEYWHRAFPPLNDFERVLPRARELASLSTPDELVVVIGRLTNPDIAYYARRRVMLLSTDPPQMHLAPQLVTQGYSRLFSWDPTLDEIDIMRYWPWSGPVGSRTYAIGASPGELRDAPVLASDDGALFDRTGGAARPLLATPLVLTCDGRSHAVPAGTAGTWLRIRGPAASRLWTSTTTPLLGPLPTRSVVVLTRQVTFGYPTVDLTCSGAAELVIERAFDAPPPH
jgi:hypothetical protein